MIKKIAALVGSGALVLGAAVPAFGFLSDIDITNDDTTVVTTSNAGAYTGENSQTVLGGRGIFWRRHRRVDASQYMSTGDARSVAGASSTTNKTRVDSDGGDVDVDNDDTTAITGADATSDTGMNDQTVRSRRGGVDAHQTMHTGDARSRSGASSSTNYSNIIVD